MSIRTPFSPRPPIPYSRPSPTASRFPADELTQLVPPITSAEVLQPAYPFAIQGIAQFEGPPRWFAALEPYYQSICPAFWTALEREEEHATNLLAVYELCLAQLRDDNEGTEEEREAVQQDIAAVWQETVNRWDASFALHGIRKRFLEYYRAEDETKRLKFERRLNLNQTTSDEGAFGSSDDDRLRTDAEIIEDEAVELEGTEVKRLEPEIIWPSSLPHTNQPCRYTHLSNSPAPKRLCIPLTTYSSSRNIKRYVLPEMSYKPLYRGSRHARHGSSNSSEYLETSFVCKEPLKQRAKGAKEE